MSRGVGGGEERWQHGERRGRERDSGGPVVAGRYSRHSIRYFSLCIADSWNCFASRALIYRPAGPLSQPNYRSRTLTEPNEPSPPTSPFSPNALALPPLAPPFHPPPPPTPAPAPPPHPLVLGYRSIYPGLSLFALFRRYREIYYRYQAVLSFSARSFVSLRR